MADAAGGSRGEHINAFLDPYLSSHLIGQSSPGPTPGADPELASYVTSARQNGHAGSTNSHGSESCPSCGGYSSPLADTGADLLKSCRNCGDTSAQSKGNKMKDFLGQTVGDYG